MADTKQKELLAKITAADKAYFEDDKPVMSDAAYDNLKRDYEAKYGKLDNIPGNVKEGFTPFTHPTPLLSLDKIFDDDVSVDSKLDTVLHRFGDTVCLQPKYDGLTVAAYPDKDGSCTFVTRGRGGIEGEILPFFVSAYTGSNVITGDLPVRGEVYLTKTDFLTIVKKQKAAGEEPFSNPRNAAAGILRNKEKSPYLAYLSYVVYEIPGSLLSTKEQLVLLKEKTRFPVTENLVCNHNLTENVRDYYSELQDKDIPIDGVVIKAYEMQDSVTKLGVTKHHPNNAVAWKKAADIYQTAVKKVTWQVGRDKLTPVAELDTIEIDGTKVSRATLHNYGFFKKLKLGQGDILNICKSGEVIPKVLSVQERSDGFRFPRPTLCPSCKQTLEIVEHDDIADIRCTNDHCFERVVQNISYLVSKDVLNVKGLSEKTARKIVEMHGTAEGELVIFSLTVADILKLPGFADKSARNLYNGLLAALQKPITISTLIKACCVTGIGGSVGQALAKRWTTVPMLKEALNDVETLKKIPGIGDKTAAVLNSIQFKAKLNAASELFTIVEPTIKEGGKLCNTVWCVTGKFPVSRSAVENLIRENGGEVTGTVNKRTDYLLLDNMFSSSLKNRTAMELGTKRVNYDFLLKLLEQ